MRMSVPSGFMTKMASYSSRSDLKAILPFSSGGSLPGVLVAVGVRDGFGGRVSLAKGTSNSVGVRVGVRVAGLVRVGDGISVGVQVGVPVDVG